MIKNKKSTFQTLMLVSAVTLSLSPLVPHYISFSGNYFSLAFSLIFLFSCVTQEISFYKFSLLVLPAVIIASYIVFPNVIIIGLILIFGFQILINPARRKSTVYFSCEYIKLFLNSFASLLSKIKIKYKLIFIFIISLVFGIINSLYWGSFTLVSLVYFLFALTLLLFINKIQILKFVTLMSLVHYWMLLLAILGFVYTILYQSPLLVIDNPDGRSNGLYLTTLSNTYIAGFIRPSGIYDEPGTFSFIICLIVALRETLSMDRRLTGRLMFLGCITFSIAHLIFLVIYLLHVYKASKLFMGIIYFVCSFYILLIIFDGFAEFSEIFLNRFSIVDGEFIGDTRSPLIKNAWEYLDTTSAIFGLNGDCILRNSNCNIFQYNPYDDNPLSLITHYGLTLSWNYYFLLLYLFYRFLRFDMIAIGVFLLLLQKPYLNSFGFSIVLVLYAYALINFSKLSDIEFEKIPTYKKFI